MHYSSYGRSKMSREHSFFSRNSLANRGLVSNLSDLHTVSACRPGRFIFSNPRSQVSSMLNCESMYLYSRGSNLQCRHLRTQAPGNQGHHGKSWACEVRRDWTYADFFSIQRANVSMYLLLLWFPSSWDNDLVFKLNNVNALKVWWADRHTDRQTEEEREREGEMSSPAVFSPLLSLQTTGVEWSQSACPSKGPLMCVGTKVSTVAFISLCHETAASRTPTPFTPTTWSGAVIALDLVVLNCGCIFKYIECGLCSGELFSITDTAALRKRMAI